jgi:formamidopyrimidine-DNA glycosylase
LAHCETHHWWFGYAHYARALADHPMIGKLKSNAMDLSLQEFRALLKGRRGAIKTFLLDQDHIAGIGNVYVQTPLWRAKIHPLRPIPTLTDGEVMALWQALRDVLQSSIDAGGARFELNLYGQKGGWDDPYLFHFRCRAENQPLFRLAPYWFSCTMESLGDLRLSVIRLPVAGREGS